MAKPKELIIGHCSICKRDSAGKYWKTEGDYHFYICGEVGKKGETHSFAILSEIGEFNQIKDSIIEGATQAAAVGFVGGQGKKLYDKLKNKTPNPTNGDITDATLENVTEEAIEKGAETVDKAEDLGGISAFFKKAIDFLDDFV